MKCIRCITKGILIVLIMLACYLIVEKGLDIQIARVIENKIHQFCLMKSSEGINSKDIQVYINDQCVYEDDTMQELFANKDAAIYGSSLAVSEIFSLQIDLENSDYIIEDKLENKFNTKKYNIPIIINEEKRVYFSLKDICRLLNYKYDFISEENRISILKDEEAVDILPSKYHLKMNNKLPIPHDQGRLGTCWAFATLQALESTLLPNEEVEFSVDHMTMNNGFDMNQNEGGEYMMSLAYLTSWKGPVYEKDDPYGDEKTDSSLKAVKHLQEAVNIKENDYQTIKRMIYLNGGVQSSIYSDIEISGVSTTYYNSEQASYYYPGSSVANHDVLIVGWDDHFSKEKFNVQPKQDGAFICQNSWGEDFGENGCFYVSYEDQNLGKHNMAYTKIENPNNYDTIYQSDLLGWVGSLGFHAEKAWFSNLYSTKKQENLEAVSFYATAPNTAYEIYVMTDFSELSDYKTRRFISSGYFEQPGYYTIQFKEKIPVSGDFAVIVNVKTKDSSYPVAIEHSSDELHIIANLEDGKGFLSVDGKNWQSAEEKYQCNICLKAFTSKGIDIE